MSEDSEFSPAARGIAEQHRINTMSKPIIEVRGLTKRYRPGDFWSSNGPASIILHMKGLYVLPNDIAKGLAIH